MTVVNKVKVRALNGNDGFVTGSVINVKKRVAEKMVEGGNFELADKPAEPKKAEKPAEKTKTKTKTKTKKSK
jgi:hypothetical protein